MNGSKCGEMMGSYLDHYKNLFCPPQKYEDYICDDPNWAYNHFSWDYWGPHNCIGSCEEPGFDCDACSNKKYFHCKRKNESVCLHPDLKCDGHQHCDDGSDENLDLCYVPYVENGIIEKYATFQCPNFHYPVIKTVATICNGVHECYGHSDESNCENETDEQFIIASVCLFLTVYWIARKGTFFYSFYLMEARCQ